MTPKELNASLAVHEVGHLLGEVFSKILSRREPSEPSAAMIRLAGDVGIAHVEPSTISTMLPIMIASMREPDGIDLEASPISREDFQNYQLAVLETDKANRTSYFLTHLFAHWTVHHAVDVALAADLEDDTGVAVCTLKPLYEALRPVVYTICTMVARQPKSSWIKVIENSPPDPDSLPKFVPVPGTKALVPAIRAWLEDGAPDPLRVAEMGCEL